MAGEYSGDNFMWIPGGEISGETQDAAFSKHDAFEISSFDFSVEWEDEKSDGKLKLKFGEAKIEKFIDSASALLYKASCRGIPIPTIMMAIRNAGGDPLLYLQYIFRDNRITGISWRDGGGRTLVNESFTFSFKAMGMQYIQQKADRTLAAGKQWAWNVVMQDVHGKGTGTLEVDKLPPAPSFLPGLSTRK
jgi:type VI secretion system secreted protein Hcp